MLSKAPSNLLGLKDKGSIEMGKNADLVVFDSNLSFRKVIKNGILY